MKIGLVCAALPPDLDGIGDYTSCLATALAHLTDATGPVPVFSRTGKSVIPDSGRVIPFYDPANPSSFAGLAAAVAASGMCQKDGSSPSWLVLQYNPFSYGRRGFCPAVPATLERVKKIPAAPRIAVMFHETMVPRWPWRFTLMYLWQRLIFRRLCRLADIAFVSTGRWTAQVRADHPELPCVHLPVGSNMPFCGIQQNEARMRLGIAPGIRVIGIFGSAHISRLSDWTALAAQEVFRRWPDSLLLYIGSEGNIFRTLCPGVLFRDEGAVSSDQLGNYLRAMDILLSPFVDGISTRRGSVMAALQHGVPVATTQSVWSDAVFGEAPPALLLSELRGPHQFAQSVVTFLAKDQPSRRVPDHALEAFYNDHFSWEILAEKMVSALNIEPGE